MFSPYVDYGGAPVTLFNIIYIMRIYTKCCNEKGGTHKPVTNESVPDLPQHDRSR